MIKADLPRNLEAVADRAEKIFKLLPKCGDPDSGLQTDIKPSMLGRLANQAGKGSRNLSLGWGLGPEQEEGVGRRQKAKEGWGSPSATEEGTTTLPVGPTAQLADSTGQVAPWDGERRGGQVDEVHLRRLDDNEVKWSPVRSHQTIRPSDLSLCFLCFLGPGGRWGPPPGGGLHHSGWVWGGHVAGADGL